MEDARVILLNGASSAGKSSLARDLQKILDEPYMHVGIDMVFDMIPKKCKCEESPRLKAYLWTPTHNGVPEVHINVGLLGHRIMSAFHKACAAFCASGISLIIDHVLLEPNWAKECLTLFSRYDLWFVGVVCPVHVLEMRERERGDRQIGLARATAFRVHEGKSYDMVVDTSLASSYECANQITEIRARKRSHMRSKHDRIFLPYLWGTGAYQAAQEQAQLA
jgi:chloramphenicol 3-O phosphotransferase